MGRLRKVMEVSKTGPLSSARNVLRGCLEKRVTSYVEGPVDSARKAAECLTEISKGLPPCNIRLCGLRGSGGGVV